MQTISEIAAELDLTPDALAAVLGISDYRDHDSLWKHGFTIDEAVEAVQAAAAAEPDAG